MAKVCTALTWSSGSKPFVWSFWFDFVLITWLLFQKEPPPSIISPTVSWVNKCPLPAFLGQVVSHIVIILDEKTSWSEVERMQGRPHCLFKAPSPANGISLSRVTEICVGEGGLMGSALSETSTATKLEKCTKPWASAGYRLNIDWVGKENIARCACCYPIISLKSLLWITQWAPFSPAPSGMNQSCKG